MKAGTFSNVLQILTSVAVLVGIGLVVYELRQNKSIAEAQIAVGGGYDSALGMYREFLADGRLMPAYVKACMNEQELTEQDILVMNNYFSYELVLLIRLDTTAESLGNGNDDYLEMIRLDIADRIRATTLGEDFAQIAFGPDGFEDGKYTHLLEHEVRPCKDVVAGYQQGIAHRAAN